MMGTSTMTPRFTSQQGAQEVVCWMCKHHDPLTLPPRNLTLGVSAVTCYLHACRNQSEAKCRKYLARIIWMLTYDDEKVGRRMCNITCTHTVGRRMVVLL